MRTMFCMAIMALAWSGFGQTPPVCPMGEGWVFSPEFSDEFNGPGLDGAKWWDFNPEWYGRKPGYFARDNDYYSTALYVMFDCEIMEGWGGLPNAADLPATFEIDYLRVWRRQEYPYPMAKGF